MTSFKKITVLSLFFALLLSVSACKKTNTPDDTGIDDVNFDRKALLTYTADEIIIPSYDSFHVKLDSLIKKSDAFTADPTLTTLAEFRQAWEEAYISWQTVELFDFGPASAIALRSFMNIYPTSTSGIANNIANTSANLDVPAAYPTQGFPALDYLLNGVGATDNDIITYYTTDTDAAARRAYITKLTDRMEDQLDYVINKWKTGGYRAEFISRDGMDISSSLPIMVNGYVLNYERYIRSGKFGLPSGAMVGGTPTPTLVEAYYKKDISLTLAKTAHTSSINLFNGVSIITGLEGLSLKKYLNAVDAKDSDTGEKLTTVINDHFDIVDTKLNLLDENLSDEVQNDNQKMLDVFNELQIVVRLLKVDMTSALSITITYVDNDGD